MDEPGGAVGAPEVPEPEYAPDGTDLTLIRWMLSLTPAERLNVLEGAVNSMLRMREYAGR